MKKRVSPSSMMLVLILAVVLLTHSAQAKDLYKILGVERNASQREIQKAFHRLSLKYHPDKNPSNSAQSRFAEINNAYEVLSDEEKRKNYDLLGDELGSVRGPEPNVDNSGRFYGFHRGNEGTDSQGWSHFHDTKDNSGPRFEQHSYGFGVEDGHHGQGSYFNFPFGRGAGAHEWSFSFGFSGDGSPFQNIFDSFLGSARGKQGQEQHFRGQTTGRTRKTKGEDSGSQSGIVAEELDSKSFQKRVLDQQYTWAIIGTSHTCFEAQEKLQLLENISKGLRGSIKVGHVNCEKYKDLCEKQKLWPTKSVKMRVYSFMKNRKLSALDYTGEWSAAAVKSYLLDCLPRFSSHLKDISFLHTELERKESRPVAVLLTQKKATPAIWCALSGFFHERIVFLDVQIQSNEAETTAKRFGVESFPAILGVYVNGESRVLSSGASLEHASLSIEKLRALLEDLERKSKAAGPRKQKDEEVPSLTKRNFKDVCGSETPLCVIGVHKSSKGKEKLQQIMKEISRKSLVRRGQSVIPLRSPISYCVVDAMKQAGFLDAFDSSLARCEGPVLIAYKPKKGSFVSHSGPINLESAESFVVEVLGGDVRFRPVLHTPKLAF